MDQTNKSRLIVLKVFGLFLLAIGLFGLGYFVGDSVAVSRVIAGQDINVITQLENTKTTYETLDVSKLWTVWDKLNTNYLEKDVDNEALFDSAIKGLIAGLDDPYSSYLTAAELTAVEKSDRGELEGIGVTLRDQDGYVLIESVIDGFPAFTNGVKAGDVVMEINDETTDSKSAVEVATLIRGPAGTKVKINFYRPSTNEDISLEITRQAINIDNITIGETRDGIVVVKIYKFTESSVDAFTDMWDEVVDKVVAMNPKGIIIDLRGNPGGYVAGVEYVLGDLLPKGQVIFYEEDRNGNRIEHVVERTGKLLNIPLALIVNSGTASASEIMAGALQDYSRAEIIGEKTVGKGVEQQLIDLDDGSQLRLVFRKWLTPNGNNINSDNPITPDILLEDYEEQTNKAFEISQ